MTFLQALALGSIKSRQAFNGLRPANDEAKSVVDLEHARGIAGLIKALDGIRQLPQTLCLHERNRPLPKFVGLEHPRMPARLPCVSSLLDLAKQVSPCFASFRGILTTGVGAPFGLIFSVNPSRKTLSALASGENTGEASN